ncbi:MAG: glycine zipper 2TM domain-containing protein [Pseudomonadota bacterium]|nr:glycine zipper 2TM domain-containing protein [Pseudomonadota bacterium]
MKFRPLRQTRLGLSLLTALAFGLAAPALAQPGPPPPPPGMPPMGTVDADGHYYGDAVPDPRPEWRGDHPGMPGQPMRGGYDDAGYQQARADWLGECRRNHGNGNMVGGAVIGGVVGGVIGNRVAGRGNRVIGTVAGAAVGAAAGGAIGSAADRRSARDYCEAYLDRNTTWQGGPGYAQGGYSYGYAPMTVMVPVMMMQASVGGQRECTTTVTTEEYVTETSRPVYHKVRRMIRPRMPAPAPDKRVRTY